MRLLKPGIASVVAELRKIGWHAYINLAEVGPAGSASAGVAILVRVHLDSGPGLCSFTTNVYRAHAIAVPMRVAKLGLVVSIKCISSLGVSTTNTTVT